MRKGVSPNPGTTPFVVIFTDLDGTLLDPHSYGWEEAEPALELCKRRSVTIILVSSKTRAEIDVLRDKLGLSSPFISENGGGIFFPKGSAVELPAGTILADNLWKWSLGSPYDLVVKCLREIRDELGWDLRGFSDMSHEEISRLTGLDLETARLAAQREYDEPFVVMDQQKVNTDALSEAARKRGLNIASGGRFFHLHGKNDKGAAVERIISWYKVRFSQVLTIALGDSPNDFTMLKQVDCPVLIRSSRDFPSIRESIPKLKITREIGPKGWNSAVSDILGENVEGGIS